MKLTIVAVLKPQKPELFERAIAWIAGLPNYFEN